MEKNGEIIVHLYNEVTSRILPEIDAESEAGGSVPSIVPEDYPCLKAFFQIFATINEIYTDYKFNLYSLIISDDSVMASYYITGNPNLRFIEPASSRMKTVITGIDVFRLADGKIVEYQEISHKIKSVLGSSEENLGPRYRRRQHSLSR